MPVPVDAHGTRTTRPGPGGPPSAPGPRSTADLWDLHAAPATLEEVAGAWRSLHLGAASAQGTVATAAHDVLTGGAWEGAAADAYDEHRTKLAADVGELATRAGAIADALDALAAVLRSAQEQLYGQWAALTAVVAHTRSGTEILFQPADAGQAAAVTDAIAAANEVRSWVDEELVLAEAKFGSAEDELTAIGETWQERTVRLVNLNIGSGHDNLNLGDKSGVAPEEVDDLAARLAGEDADIATLQEVFSGDLGRLEDELEERTGDEWNVHFTEASRKTHWTSPLDWFDPDHVSEPFGNAVLVREGDVIGGSDTVDDHIKLDEPGSVARPGPPPSTPTPGTTTTTLPDPPLPPDTQILDDEGRAAIHVEVDFRES